MSAMKLATVDTDGQTLAALLNQNASRFGAKRAALRIKRRGIWQESSWAEYLDNVRLFSLGLTATGLEAGDTVAIISSNRPDALYAMLAAGTAGGVPVALHHDATSAEIRAAIIKFDIKYLFAEDQEQVDKILESGLPAGVLKRVIYFNPRGMRRYREEFLLSFEQFSAAGNALYQQEPEQFAAMCAGVSSSDTAIICTTSGSSGPPHGAMLSHANLISMATALADSAGLKEGDEFVSFLPLAWFGELMISLAAALLKGFTINFPESPATIMADLREIGPHIIFAPPQIWEGIASSIQVRMMESTPFKRFMYNSFMPAGRRAADLRLAGKTASLSARIMYAIAHVALMRALRDRLGLSRVRAALTGGSSLGKDVFRYFHSLGVNLKQVYGLTEISGVACMHRDNGIKADTVGQPLPGTEISFTADGEILLKSAGVFQGYYGEEQATADVIKDGWLHSGDAGFLDDDGQLIVTDRLENIFALADGTRVAPAPVESRLKFSPYIKETVVIGRNRPFLTALVCIDGKVAGKWAGDNKIAYNSYSDLAAKGELCDFIATELAKANGELPESLRVKRFVILYKELDADDEEMTRTGKVRRKLVEERFKPLIDALYEGLESMAIDATVNLQEGRMARIQSRVLFRNLG